MNIAVCQGIWACDCRVGDEPTEVERYLSFARCSGRCFANWLILLTDAPSSRKLEVLSLAKVFRETGMRVISLVATHLDGVNDEQQAIARDYIEKLRKRSDFLFLLPDAISWYDIYRDMENTRPMVKWETIRQAFICLTSCISESDLPNPFEHLLSLLQNDGTIFADESIVAAPQTVMDAVQKVIASPRLQGRLHRAKVVLAHVDLCSSVSLDEIRSAMALLRDSVHPQATMLWHIDYYEADRTLLDVTVGGLVE